MRAAAGGAHAGLTVSVVIPVRNDARWLARCLDGLATQTVQPLEVIVVDNGCTDDTVAVATAHGARVVPEPAVGIAPAAATGYDAARGDIIARCDADSRPGPRWVERIVTRLADDPGLDAVTGTGGFYDVPRPLRPVAELGYLGAYYGLTHLALGHTSLWGSSMAVRRTAWTRVRGAVHRADPEVHDDLDLAFALGPRSRIRLDPRLRLGVSGRSLRGRAQRRRRMRRARRTLMLNWDVAPPWRRWQERLTRWGRPNAAQRTSASHRNSCVTRKPVR